MLGLLLMSAAWSQTQTLLIIGTGSVVGLYYPVGGAVSVIVNDSKVIDESEDLVLTVKVTPGSVANIEALERGEVDLALVQSDVLHQAYNGEGLFPATLTHLRTLMGLHAEPLHLVCRRDAAVSTLKDIMGKDVNIGNIGSGHLNTVRTVLAAYDIHEDVDFIAHYELPDKTPEMLAAGDLDCFFYTVGIGGAAIQATAALVDITLVPLNDPELMHLVAERPYYIFVKVPAGTYRGIDEDITLFGVRAVLVTTDDLPDETALQVVRELLVSFDKLRETHPALEPLMRDGLLQGLSVPLHEGAAQAFSTLGLIN